MGIRKALWYSSAMPRSRISAEQSAPVVDREWRLHEFRHRLDYVGDSYRYWKDIEASRPTFNESLELLQRELYAPNRRHREPTRLHPMIEIGASMIALKYQAGSILETKFSPAPLEAARHELLRRTKPIRGRPENPTLSYHVKGLILACEWATGVPVTASGTTNSLYDPQMTSDGASAIKFAFRRIDPSVTTTSLVNIVRRVRRRRELEGKRFEDFFPLYRPSPHPHLGMIGCPSVNLQTAYPIYCT